MIKAPGSFVIVEVVYKDRESSLIIPDHAKKREGSFHGKVISIGPDYPDKSLKVGNKVAFRRHEGFPIRYKDKEYLSLRERWVNAKIK